MDHRTLAELYDRYLMRTYRPMPVGFVRGAGCRLWDAQGREYLDFVAGIAVLGTGHCHPRVVAAVQKQAGRLAHTSNLYHIEPQARLAQRLVELSCADRCFFCNSGTEANEAAIKLARKWGRLRGRGSGIVAALGSFHGRTMGALAATGQEKYRQPFEPLSPGFTYVPFDDLAALETAVDQTTCAVMLEPVQAEGGINVPGPGYLPAVRELCDRRGALLILDEVQTGLGRTGRWFGYQHWGAEPDVLTLAKSLGSGLPLGACLAQEHAAVFEPGDHAATFGGNHLCCAAGLATLEVIEEEGLVQQAAERGEFLADLLTSALAAHPAFRQVRGLGLLRALQFDPDYCTPAELQAAALAEGLVINAMGQDRVRLAPPLVLTEQECRRGAEILVRCFEQARDG